MCSISGFSFTAKSKFDARKLASALLVAGESRGTDATGFATFDPTIGQIDSDSKNVRASEFVKHGRFTGLDSDSRVAILHTRYATQGSPTQALNNHPVCHFAPTGEMVAAVHNGCIYNDNSLFFDYEDNFTRYAAVDSEIIPALIAHKGSDKYADIFSEIRGSVASAWLDERTGSTLHITRAESSPVQIAVINEPRRVSRRGNLRPRLQGVVFASTAKMLTAGLATLGLQLGGKYAKWYELDEGQYFSVSEGIWNETVQEYDLSVPAKWSGGFGYGGYGMYGDDYGQGRGFGRSTRTTKRDWREDAMWDGKLCESPTDRDDYDKDGLPTYEDDPDNLAWPMWKSTYGQRSSGSHGGYGMFGQEGYDSERGLYVMGPSGTVQTVRDTGSELILEESPELTLDKIIDKLANGTLRMQDIDLATASGALSQDHSEYFLHTLMCDEDGCVFSNSDICRRTGASLVAR